MAIATPIFIARRSTDSVMGKAIQTNGKNKLIKTRMTQSEIINRIIQKEYPIMTQPISVVMSLYPIRPRITPAAMVSIYSESYLSPWEESSAVIHG